jgi:hypothetical protein
LGVRGLIPAIEREPVLGFAAPILLVWLHPVISHTHAQTRSGGSWQWSAVAGRRALFAHDAEPLAALAAPIPLAELEVAQL